MWQQVKNIYHLFVAFIANIYYGFPARKLVVIGVTGTSGKTTTCHMIYDILKEAGLKVSLLSTIKAIIGDKEYDTGFHVTTPNPHTLPNFLHKAVLNGDKFFVLETSSHALDQNRVAFVHFAIGVLTSLAHEHLDYHKTFVNYAKAKFKLLHNADVAILPEGSIGSQLKPHVNYDALAKKIITFGLGKGDETQEKWHLNLKSTADFNLLNGLAAATVAVSLGMQKELIKKTLGRFVSLPGRYEEISTKKKFRIIIDFAHKPDALEQLLLTVKKEIKKVGRIIVMFGCASERDILKRPIMGEISAKLADITVLTDEDPRWEDSMKIINEIADGCIKGEAIEYSYSSFSEKEHFSGHFFLKIQNRREAIKYIMQKLAKKGDIVLLCGKGHERSINYKGVETPWDEHAVVREALRFRSK